MSSSVPPVSDSVLHLAWFREQADAFPEARTVLANCLVGVSPDEAPSLAERWLSAAQQALKPDANDRDTQALRLVAETLHVPVDYFRTTRVRALVDSWISLREQHDQKPSALAIQGPCRGFQLGIGTATQLEQRLIRELPNPRNAGVQESESIGPSPELADPFVRQSKGARVVPAEQRPRSYNVLVMLARQKLSELGLRPPFDIELLRQALELQRGTNITLVPTDEMPPGAAFAVTGRQGDVEVVLHESRTTAFHQKLIVLHEFAHMLLEHPPSVILHSQVAPAPFREIDAAAVAEALGRVAPRHKASVSERLGRWLMRSRQPSPPQRSASSEPNVYTQVCEGEAETLATILLDWLPDSSVRRGVDQAVDDMIDALGHRWSPW